MAKAKQKPCGCLKAVQDELAKDNLKLDTAFELTHEAGTLATAGPFLAVHWIEKRRDGRKLPMIACTHCPFCGNKK